MDSLKCAKESYTGNNQKNIMWHALAQFLLLFLNTVFKIYLLT